MNPSTPLLCTAFAGPRQIASGPLEQVAIKAKAMLDANPAASILIFNDASSELVEVDFRGTADDMLQRLGPAKDADIPPPAAARGPGRPKLGVVAREVTLLPRHWDWLNAQPGGASVVLRKLVEEAKRTNSEAEQVRQSREASLRFMSAMAGDYPGYEDATRALFAGQRAQFRQMIVAWPADIRTHALKLAEASFAAAPVPPKKST